MIGQFRNGKDQGPEGGCVPKAAVRLFEVRLEQEGDVTVGGVTFLDPFRQLVQPGGLLLCPAFLSGSDHGLGQVVVAADDPRVEQAEGNAKIGRSDFEDVIGLSDAVVEMDSLVPHRVPDPVGDTRHVLSAPMDQDHVQVAERAQFPPAIAAHGNQG